MVILGTGSILTMETIHEFLIYCVLMIICLFMMWTRCSMLIQRYGVNADGSRWDPERDDTLRLEDVKHDGVRWFQSVTVSRG